MTVENVGPNARPVENHWTIVSIRKKIQMRLFSSLESHSLFLWFIGGQAGSCETTIVIVRLPIIISLQWESMAAHRTPWSKVVKCGTLIQDSPIIPWSKFVVASSWALAPTGQSWTCIHVIAFDPFIQYSQPRYHFNISRVSVWRRYILLLWLLWSILLADASCSLPAPWWPFSNSFHCKWNYWDSLHDATNPLCLSTKISLWSHILLDPLIAAGSYIFL